MAKTTKDLEADYKAAEAKAYKISADYEDAIAKVKARYLPRAKAAADEARAAQKLWMDAHAADGLRDRPDGQAVADALGLTL